RQTAVSPSPPPQSLTRQPPSFVQWLLTRLGLDAQAGQPSGADPDIAEDIEQPLNARACRAACSLMPRSVRLQYCMVPGAPSDHCGRHSRTERSASGSPSRSGWRALMAFAGAVWQARQKPLAPPGLNQVERWFALLTDKRLRRGVHKNVHALEKDLRDWISSWNENPRPFIWTKIADEIYERLNSYLQRIPGAQDTS